MIISKKNILTLAFCITTAIGIQGQEGIHYTGKILSNVDYHHGQLAPAIGTHNIQTFRANREYPNKAEGLGWTYACLLERDFLS